MTGKAKSIVLTEYGEIDKIKVMDWPIPTECKDTEVEVKVIVCGANFADVYVRLGFLAHLKTPRVLGLECVGRILRVGCEVTKFKVGERVLCYKWTGGLYRERVIIEEKYCTHIPEEISDQLAVCLPSQYCTAYISLFDFGNLRPNQSVLILSCAGGLGVAAIQLCKTVPNIIIHGTTSSHKFEFAKSQGVHKVFTKEDLMYRTKLNVRYDIVIDSLGGEYSQIVHSLLKPLGRRILIGAASIIGSDEPPEIKDIVEHDLIISNTGVFGLHLGFLNDLDPDKFAQVLDSIFKLCLEKKLHACIHGVYKFDEVIKSQEQLVTRRNKGKVLLVPW